MADTSTQRARRHRRHVAGDHSLCLPNRCRALSPGLPITTSRPSRNVSTGRGGFEESGQQLWDAAQAELKLGALQTPLLVEACRIADRLDVLDAQLHGHDWLRFRHDESGAEVTVYVDRVLAEAREQATALRGIVAELTKPAGKSEAEPEKKGGGVLADLAAARAARSAQTAG